MLNGLEKYHLVHGHLDFLIMITIDRIEAMINMLICGIGKSWNHFILTLKSIHLLEKAFSTKLSFIIQDQSHY